MRGHATSLHFSRMWLLFTLLSLSHIQRERRLLPNCLENENTIKSKWLQERLICKYMKMKQKNIPKEKRLAQCLISFLLWPRRGSNPRSQEPESCILFNWTTRPSHRLLIVFFIRSYVVVISTTSHCWRSLSACHTWERRWGSLRYNGRRNYNWCKVPIPLSTTY